MSRVLTLGIDAFDGRHLQRLLDAGRLPHLAALRARGSQVTLSSVADCFAGAVWPTILTGQGPGAHNVADHFRLAPGAWKVKTATVDGAAITPAHHGCWPPVRALLFDVPKTTVTRRAGDTEVVGWGLHAARGAREVWPPSLAPVLRRWAPPWRDGEQESDCDDAAWRERLAVRLIDSLHQRAALGVHLLRDRPWELAVLVASEVHAAGHRLFDTPALLDEVAVAADAWVGALLDAVGPDVHRVVLSGHGMEPAVHARPHLLPWLRRWLGLPAPPVETGPAFWMRQRVGRRVRDVLRTRLPPATRHHVRAHLMGRAHGAPGWPQMDAFPVPSEDHGYVRLNIAGREPGGRLTPEEAATLADALEEDLLGWRCAATGAPVVAAVHRPQQRFPGPFAGQLPDLVATWSRQGPQGDTIVSPRVGPITASSVLDHRVAEHRAEGWLLTDVEGLAASGRLEDVAPTLLALLGRAVPEVRVGHSLANGGYQR